MIWIVHHADAVPADVEPQRPLTSAGLEHARQLAARARDRGVKPDVVWHSGKLRARQTAEEFWRACNPLASFSATRGLQPGDPPEWIRDVLLGERREVLLVGHMPNVARVLDVLTRSGASPPEFPLHGLVALEAEGDSWREAWRLL